MYFLITALCMTCVFTSVLFLQGRGYREYINSLSAKNDSQTLFVSCKNSAHIEQLYSDIISDPSIPSPEIVSLSNSGYAGLYWTDEASQDLWYIPYGRLFTIEEINTGAHVALLGTSFIGSLPLEERETVWRNGIFIGNEHFQALGNFYFEWLDNVPDWVSHDQAFSAAIIIPLQSFLNCGMEATRLHYTFSRLISQSELEHLNSLINQYDDLTNFSLPPANNKKAVSVYFQTVSVSSIILLLGIISLVDIIVNWSKQERSRYKSYFICGAHSQQVIFILLFNMVMLVSISLSLALIFIMIITYITPIEIIIPLSVSQVILTYIVLLLITLCITLTKFARFFHSKTVLL